MREFASEWAKGMFKAAQGTKGRTCGKLLSALRHLRPCLGEHLRPRDR